MKKIDKILQNYKKNLQKFIKNNNLDKENFLDIEARISEKLNKIENPTESDIKNILHEIWTPEEIFAEELWEKMIRKPKNFWEKIKQKTDKIILLWVFYELGKKTWISGNIYRIIFLFLLFVWIFWWAWGIIVFLIFSYFFWFLFLRTWIFWFLFLGFLWVLCSIFAFLGIIFLWIYISWFHVENIYPFLEISYLLPIWLGIWIFSMTILAIFFFYYAFFRKNFWLKFFLTWIISFIISIIFAIWILWNTYFKYYWLQSEEKTFEFDLKNKKELNILNYFKIDENIFYSKNNFINIANPNLNFWKIIPSENNKMIVKLEKNVILSKDLSEKYKNFVKDFKLQEKNDFIELQVEFDKEKKYPIIPVFFKLSEIKIPKNIIFNTFYWNLPEQKIYFKNENDNEKINNQIFKLCEKYFFDEEWKLHCEEKEAERILKNLQKDFTKK